MLGVALGAFAGLSAATAAGWASMHPGSQLYGRTFLGGRDTAGRKLLALTYDDGPNDPHTGALLEVLARHGARATFFMIGSYVAAQPRLAVAVAQAGHEIGNHTFTHPNLIFCSPVRIASELRDCESALTDVVGEHTRLFRPPFGGRRPDVLSSARRLGLEPVMWSVSAKDWKLPSARAIEEQVMRHIHGGDVILMHDGSHHKMGFDRSNTVRATDALIQRCKEQGFEFVTVGEMMKIGA